MIFAQFHRSLLALEAVFDIDHAGSTVKWRSPKYDETEAILHELVHGVCLGNPRLAAYIETSLPTDPGARADHELKTLRVARRVYELVELPLTRAKARQLFAAANFDDWPVTLAQFEAPLTAREETLARATVQLIKYAQALVEFEIP